MIKLAKIYFHLVIRFLSLTTFKIKMTNTILILQIVVILINNYYNPEIKIYNRYIKMKLFIKSSINPENKSLKLKNRFKNLNIFKYSINNIN